MTVDEAQRKLIDAEILSESRIEEVRVAFVDSADAPDDGRAFLRFLVDRGDLTTIEETAVVTGMPADFAIGPYRLIEELAIGRIGRTFRAVHTEFNQPVSLKLLPASLTGDREGAVALARETRVAAQVDDPHVIRMFQVGSIDRYVFLVKEALEGESLATRLHREGSLPFLESLRITRQIALGLAHLHGLEILHRDVQPKNVWLHRDGRAILTEFAAAKDALEYLDREPEDDAEGFTFTEDALVNYDFLSAEQGVDSTFADERSDLYSLGCVLFRCLTGQVVFPDANPVRKMLRHALTEAPSISETTGEKYAGIDEVAAMLLAKSPDDRYQHARDVAWALEQLIATDVEKAIAVHEVNPEFLAWANSTPDLGADPSAAGLVGDRDFLDFLGHLVDEDDEEDSDDFEPDEEEDSDDFEPDDEEDSDDFEPDEDDSESDEELDASEGTRI